MLMSFEMTRQVPRSVYSAIEDKHYRGRNHPIISLFCNPVLLWLCEWRIICSCVFNYSTYY